MVGGQDGEIGGVCAGVRTGERRAKELMDATVESERGMDKVGVRVTATLDFRVEG